MALVCFAHRPLGILRTTTIVATLTIASSPVAAQQPQDEKQNRVQLSTPPEEPITVKLVKPESETSQLATFLKDYSALVAVLITACGWWLSNRNVTKQLMAKRKEESRAAKRELRQSESERIRTKLDEFYRPYLQLSDTNKELHSALKGNQATPDEFRLLTSLLNAAPFSNNDQALVGAIAEMDGKLAEMIATKSGHVEDSEIHTALSEAGLHFRVLILAHEGKLTGQAQAFEKHLYPRELDGKLRNKVTELEGRLRQLDDELAKLST